MTHERGRRGADAASWARHGAQGTANNASPTNTQAEVETGRLLVSLMMKTSEAAGITDLSKIQFNFNLKDANGKPVPNPGSRENVRTCILAYLSSGKASKTETDAIESNLYAIMSSLPTDAGSLKNYTQTLTSRGNSYYQAAKLMLEHSGLGEEDKGFALAKLNELRGNYLGEIGPEKSESMNQTYFNGFLNALPLRIAYLINKTQGDESLHLSEEAVTKTLKEAETIINIKDHKAQITLTGTVDRGPSGILSSTNISAQIDEPRNRFSDLSTEQQQEWRKVYATSKTAAPEYPAWFAKLSDIEKNIWLQRMSVLENGGDPHMGPVVKKQGIPGLRNLMLSSFATVKVSGSGEATASISAKSIRSSNLLAQKKDGTFNLSKTEKELTVQNIKQAEELFSTHNKPDSTGFAYSDENRKPYILCQTLVRLIGGGDDFVLKNKKAAIKTVNAQENSNRVFDSNHCIGTPKGSNAVHMIMHALGANTKSTKHITTPVKDFMENAVIHSAEKNGASKAATQGLRDLYEQALKGKPPEKEVIASAARDCKLSDQQAEKINSALQATSMYMRESGTSKSYAKTHQLHMAALENIIYENTGNCVQSSCKSGKDREGALKNYRNAMREFYDKKGYWPPSTSKNEVNPGDRQEFVKIFVELFKSNHQARLAELNAAGCEGQKALNNILPKDILKEVKSTDEGLLKAHKKNSSLNDMGHSSVKADEDLVDLMRKKEVSTINTEKTEASISLPQYK